MNRLGSWIPFLVFGVRSVNAMNSLPVEVMPISKSPHSMSRCSCLPLSPKWRVLFIHTEFNKASGLSEIDSLPYYTPPLKCGEVLCYTLRCLSVCPSVRPSAPFPIYNLSIYSRNFFKFCIHIVICDEWYGIVNGQNPSIFNRVTALFRIGKMVSGLLFLYYS